MNNIFRNFLIFLVTFSVLIFLVGIFEASRDEYMFDIMEDNFLNAGSTPTGILNDYYDFRNHYVFSNTVFVDLLNYIGMLGLFLIFVFAWRDGWKARKETLSQVFISYGLLFILLLYFFIIIANYLIEIFINQIIVVLFDDIYTSVYIFQLFIDYFIFLFILAFALYFFANQLSNFSLNNN